MLGDAKESVFYCKWIGGERRYGLGVSVNLEIHDISILHRIEDSRFAQKLVFCLTVSHSG